MDNNFVVTWDRALCRTVIDRLRDGLPPPPEAIEVMSVGYESHLEQAKIGLSKACAGGYGVMLLEGRYGIGKSHLLNIIGVIAKQQGFVVKHVEVGTGRIYLNSPQKLFKQILCGESEPWKSEYDQYGPYYGDKVHRFVAGLKILTSRYLRNGAPGMVILFDELEGTFDRNKLPRFPSRAKAYNVLEVFFKGADGRTFSQELWYASPLALDHIYTVLAITPGTLDTAKHDGTNSYFVNPAATWVLPPRRKIRPLEFSSVLELARRVRVVHSQAFDWQASDFVSDVQLEQLCQAWCAHGETRDDRELVKQLIEVLESTEQNR